MNSVRASKASLRIWWLLVFTFLAAWLAAVLFFGYGPLAAEHWPMAVVMIAGSLVAGSTPMGGGSVSFPILVYVFHELPEHARSFGLAIQALGMTSALIFIVCRRIPLQARLLISSCAGAAGGMVLGTFVVGPLVARTTVKLLFACLWMSFAILTMARNREFCSLKNKPYMEWRTALIAGIPLGLLGGLIAAMIGVGLEMVIYTVLVLAFRSDLKVAVPTAVCATAVTSLIGVALHIGMGDIPRAIFGTWLACAPIVIFGAPAGAYVATRLSRVKILYVVSALCVFQFFWTLHEVSLGALGWFLLVAALAIANGGFYLLYRTGIRSDADRQEDKGVPASAQAG